MIERILNYFGYHKVNTSNPTVTKNDDNINTFLDITKLDILCIYRSENVTIISYFKDNDQRIHLYSFLCSASQHNDIIEKYRQSLNKGNAK